jgi:type VI secretion system secreted protein VgrG
MPEKLHTPSFLFVSAAADVDTFYVKELYGRDTLCDLWHFEVILDSLTVDIPPKEIINSGAAVFLFRNGSYYPYSGIVTEFSFIKTSADYSTYRAVLRPQLSALLLSTQSRVFQKMSVPDILKKVLDDAGLSQYHDIKLTASKYPKRDYTVQFQESDYNFLLRTMQYAGIWYQFTEAPVKPDDIENYSGTEKMVISDAPSTFTPIPDSADIKYRAKSGMVQIVDKKEYENIYEINLTRNVIPTKVTVKGYNYRTPDVDMIGNASIQKGDTGTVYEYGGEYYSVSEATAHAQLIADRIASGKITICGKSICSGFRSGSRMSIVEHGFSMMNQQYIITEVLHSGRLDNKDGGMYIPVYRNDFKGFPSSNAHLYHPEFTAKKVVMPDFMTARIEGTGTEYSTIDDQGRYKVRMPFDISENASYQGSKYIRMLQAYSGPQYGMHFPTHENAEIIISHINGDPNRPIGIRVVPDNSTASPVNNNNSRQSMIKTAGNNQIIMDDSKGKQHFTMSTPYDMNLSAGNNQSISITANRKVTVSGNETKKVDGNQSLSVKGNRSIDIAGDSLEKITGDSVIEVKGNAKQSVSGNKEVTVSGDVNETCKLTRSVEVGGDLKETISGSQGIESSGLHLTKVGGNMTLKTGKTIGINAKAALTIMGNAVTVKASSMIGVEAGASSATVSSKDGVALSAPAIMLTAGKVEFKAQGTCNATGLALLLN